MGCQPCITTCSTNGESEDCPTCIREQGCEACLECTKQQHMHSPEDADSPVNNSNATSTKVLSWNTSLEEVSAKEAKDVSEEQISVVEEVAQEKIASINAVAACMRGEEPPEGCDHLFVTGSEEGGHKQAMLVEQRADR